MGMTAPPLRPSRPPTSTFCVARWALLATLIVTAAASGTVAAEPSRPCLQDGDCLGMRLCRANRCRRVECEADAGCPAGRTCRAYTCVRSHCDTDDDCGVERRCGDGVCIVPPPPPLRNGSPIAADTVTVDLSAGLAYPIGMLVCAELAVGTSRYVSIGVSTSADYGGFGWRIGVRGAPRKIGPFEGDVWVALLGLSGDAASKEDDNPDGGVGAILRGSGRGLFAWNQAFSAMWWGAGAGLTWRHGEDKRWLVRLEAGALLLMADRYPPDRDYTLLPNVSVRYGYSW